VDVIGRYLEAQIEAGADAVQVFESWGGVLSNDDFHKWSIKPIQKIFSRLSGHNVPRILFVNNVAPYLDMVRDLDCEVVGIDHRVSLRQAADALPGKSVQGNLDPSALFGSIEQVKEKTRKILDSLDDLDRLVFNLGHGIQPTTPIEAVEAMVETVHTYRK
jgi:uroporphyrinogen decarboxylase